MQIRVDFDEDFPQNLIPEVETAISPHLKLLEREIVLLRVSFGDGGIDGAVAASCTRRMYHRADLWISHEFFSYDAEEQSQTILHEFFHILFDPLTREIQRVILNFVSDGPTRTHLLEVFEDLEERVVDGVAWALSEESS